MALGYPISGYEGKIYSFLEATYGVGPTNEEMGELYLIESFEPNIDPSLIEIRGVGSRNVQMLKRGLTQAQIKLVMIPKADLLGFIDYIIENPQKSYSLEAVYQRGAEIISLRHFGCCLNKLEMSCAQDEMVRAEMEFWAQRPNSAAQKWSTGTYGTQTGDLLAWYQTYLKKGGAVTEKCVSWKFSVNENLKRLPVIRSAEGNLLKYMQRRQRAVEGELVFTFDSNAEYLEVVDDTEFALEFGFETVKKATLSGCKWSKITLPTNLEDVPVNLPFTAKSIAFAAQ
jgi:hypothetical protein